MKTTLTALAAGVAAITLAAPASADQNDFISKLNANGVAYRDITGMIDTGQGVCGAMRSHYPVPEIRNSIVRSGFSGMDAGRIIVSASETMCPDTLQWLSAQEHMPPPPGMQQNAPI